MIKYIFFDFDGVLAESVNVKTEAFRQMYLSYGEDFAKRVVDFHLANGGVSRFEKVKLFNSTWLGEEVTDSRIIQLADTFSELSVNGVINAPEVVGANEFLKNTPQYIKYIITGTPTPEIKRILKARGMFEFFEGVYGSPEKKDFWLKKILVEKSINHKDCVFVGDALADYDAAVRNDVHFILRETPEGKDLFANFTGLRIQNLTELENTIQTITDL